MRQQEILHNAFQQFTTLTGAVWQPAVPLDDEEQQVQEPAAENVLPDAEYQLAAGEHALPFKIMIKNELREIQLAGIIDQLAWYKDEWLLICQYIPAPVKAELRRRGFNYLEAAGNCFIRKGTLFFFINDQAVTPVRQPVGGKLWKGPGLKFLFLLLTRPALLNEPYRRLAAAAGVALGNVGAYMEELETAGFIITHDRQKEWLPEHRDTLQQRWVELFHTLLKPRLLLGRFRFVNADNATKWEQQPTGAFYWGGEPAGALLTGFLAPQDFTVYTHQPTTEVMKALRLVPDPNGNVYLYQAFWQEEEGEKIATVPPLLVYADLITHLDSRNRETAQRIKEQVDF